MFFLVLGRRPPVKLVGPFSQPKHARAYASTKPEFKSYIIAKAVLPNDVVTQPDKAAEAEFHTKINPPPGRNR